MPKFDNKRDTTSGTVCAKNNSSQDTKPTMTIEEEQNKSDCYGSLSRGALVNKNWTIDIVKFWAQKAAKLI